MVWGGDFVSSGQQGRISHTDLVIGCLVDLATGLMTFTANGKESNTFFQVSPALCDLAVALLCASILGQPSQIPLEARSQKDRTKIAPSLSSGRARTGRPLGDFFNELLIELRPRNKEAEP